MAQIRINDQNNKHLQDHQSRVERIHKTVRYEYTAWHCIPTSQISLFGDSFHYDNIVIM
jgi:hypothetical protein